MVKRRKVLIGAGSLLAGGAAATGTGAFSAMEAERGLDVEIAGDGQGYLKFNTDLGNSPDNNYEYAEINDKELVIDFDTNNAGGDGVNYNSVMFFDDVFALENNGTEPLEIWVELGGGLDQYLDVYPIAGNFGQGDSLVGASNAFSAPWATGVGSTLRVGIKVDTTQVDLNNAELEGTITIHADSV
jgi:hypothetical protein